MKKQFLLNLSLLFLVNLLVKPTWIFADLMVQRETGASYGIYFVLLNLTLLLNIFLDLGTSNFNNRKVAAHTSKFTTYFSRFFTLRLVLSIVYLAILLITALVLGYEKSSYSILLMLGFNQILVSFITYFRSNLTALGYFKYDALISILDRLIMIAIISTVLWSHSAEMSIERFVQIQLIGYLTGAMVAFIILFSKEGLFKLRWKWKFNKTLLRKSLPYALIVILMSAYSYADSLMLKGLRVDGIKQNAIYAQSFRIIMAINNYTFLISVLLLPLFSKMIRQQQGVQNLVRLSGTLLLYGTGCLALIFHLFSSEFVHLLYGIFPKDFSLVQRFGSNIPELKNLKEVKYSAEVFSFLLLVSLPMSFNYIYGVLITAGGRMKMLNIMAAVAVIANLALNYLLIPAHGAIGAAIASLTTQSLFAVGQCIYAYYAYSLPFSKLHFLKFILVFCVIYGLHWSFKDLISPLELLTLIVVAAGCGLLFFRIITWGNIKRHLLNP